jgi:DNA-binding NtrC family response regulator
LDLHCCIGFIEARRLLRCHNYSVVLCSDSLTDGTYADVISVAKPVPVVVYSRLADWGGYFEALNAGAFDYIAYPPSAFDMGRTITSALAESSRLLANCAAAK